jgi:ferric-dicitrate binding protein FerR (iron transport regulator)
MNDHLQPNPLDENLRRMIESAVEKPSQGFEDRLVADVLAEVARQKGHASVRAGQRPWWIRVAAAAAVMLIAVGIWIAVSTSGHGVGRLSRVYGVVGVQDNGVSHPIGDAVELRSGQRVETHSGSKAQITLADQSKVTPDPRTRLQIAQTRLGPNIVLEQGAIRVQAAAQPAGRSISIVAADSHVKVLGTDLDVRLVIAPGGTQQTRVHVRSGSVEMASAGRKVVLLPGTEGLAEKGKAPVRSSVVFEVNELIRLFE